MTRSRRPRIGVLVDLIVRFGRDVATGVAAYGHIENWELILRPIWRLTDSRMAELFDADGLIISVYDHQIVGELLQRKIPVVNIASIIAPGHIPSVLIDHHKIGEIAALHLVDAGVKTLVVDLPPGDVNTYWARARSDAFIAAAHQAKVPVYSRTGSENNSAPSRARSSQVSRARWLAQMPRPVGVFACNDQHALEIMNECYDAGLKIPRDIAILGCDNDELINRFAFPSLSSISVDFTKQGYLAAELLDRQISHQQLPSEDQIVLVSPTGVIQRESTRLFSVSDPDVALAIEYITVNQHRPITVDEVVGATSISRRTLEQRFRRVRRKTILQEILHVKIERAKRLLSETDLKMGQIASACGFGSRIRFFTAFRQYVGITPQNWRTQGMIR